MRAASVLGSKIGTVSRPARRGRRGIRGVLREEKTTLRKPRGMKRHRLRAARKRSMISMGRAGLPSDYITARSPQAVGAGRQRSAGSHGSRARCARRRAGSWPCGGNRRLAADMPKGAPARTPDAGPGMGFAPAPEFFAPRQRPKGLPDYWPASGVGAGGAPPLQTTPPSAWSTWNAVFWCRTPQPFFFPEQQPIGRKIGLR